MKKVLLYIGVGALLFTSCADDGLLSSPTSDMPSKIELSGEIDQVLKSRVDDGGFTDGDVMGVYIVDYQGANPGTLQTSGNRGDNVAHTFIEADQRWSSAYDVYWKDKTTHIDVYGYYPYANPQSIDSYPFTVKRDQSTETTANEMGGYEASDFLWGKASDITPTENKIRLSLTHRMANARVTLVEGGGFGIGEWAATEKVVLIPNLAREASINLATGEVTCTGSIEQVATIPVQRGDEWRAIVVPQTVAAGTSLFSITIGGTPYKFAKDEAFTYVAGKMSNFAIRVDKKTASGQYTLTLVSESITAWENDLVSHDATLKEYVQVNSTPGKLKEAIAAANKDYTKLRNLKITGEIDIRDFYFMRDEMSVLSALNLKEVRIKASENGTLASEFQHEADEIPNHAMSPKTTLTRLILPDRLTKIRKSAFFGCGNLSGSLIIPEGVTTIEEHVFGGCRSFTGILSLPSTLEHIGNGAFFYCGFVCELKLPVGLKSIGESSFGECSGFYGELRLPDKLESIGYNAFSYANFTGSLTIPQGVSIIGGSTFIGVGFDGNLILHDGIISIGEGAFEYNAFKGELNIPKHLSVIRERAFGRCNFSGKLKIPESMEVIGENAFENNVNLTGVLEFPNGMKSIGAHAFAACRGIEGLVFPESLESVGDFAFIDCYGIGSIVCKGEIPPYVGRGAFDGVPKDNFTLEVPESAVVLYQTAPGWRDFKRISAHHELVCRPAVACALQTERTQTLIVDAEGDWVVDSKPDWCEVTPSSGSKKTEVMLTIKEMAAGSAEREGEVVFRLKEEDYTHRCKVTQYGYTYGEDEPLTLQKASKGNTGGINLVFLGDGYSAADIASGQYLTDIKAQVENFFAIEPYNTYRDYFNVYTSFPVSAESGIGALNTIRDNRFNTTNIGGVGYKSDFDEIFRYSVEIAPTLTEDNLDRSLIVIVPNSKEYGGLCHMWASGAAVAYCPMNDYDYPYDTRGVVQHEAGGHGFGKLGEEYIYHNAFIDACVCCGGLDFSWEKSLGWFANLETTGKMHEVGWSHLIFDDRYSDIVDIFEGGYMHSRGVFRSEQNSCMNNNIPYYSTISRESIVRRIMNYAGETFDFEDFVSNDKRGVAVNARADYNAWIGNTVVRGDHSQPVIIKGKPTIGKRKANYVK